VNTRSGKHKRGKVRMGIYVEPFRKAIALLVAEECKMTMTDVIWHGIESIAIGHGILDTDGNVTKEFKARLAAAKVIVEQSEVNG
jgi:hypothetical protein